MIKPPRDTSKRVENSVRECWARLAKLQFKEAARAVHIVGNEWDIRHGPIPERMAIMTPEQRMEKVETYLQLAGAEATKNYFSAYVE